MNAARHGKVKTFRQLWPKLEAQLQALPVQGKPKPPSPGDADNHELFKAALLQHHHYPSRPLNTEPIGPADLDRQGVFSKATASRCFGHHFDSHAAYCRICADEEVLFLRLELLAGDSTPAKLRRLFDSK